MTTSLPSDPARSAPASSPAWKHDLLSSLVVFLVAVPLCLGIALASEAPAAAGLLTGIVGGILVGAFAGSPLQVSGPAAGLTVICGEIIRQNGMPAFGMSVLIAGVLQLIAGILRLGQWFRAVSPAVIHGMLSGIGILILCSQLHVLMDEAPRENAPKNLAAMPESFQKGLAWPVLESVELRKSRTTLLRRAASINTRQKELSATIKRELSSAAGENSATPATATQNPPVLPPELPAAQQKIHEAVTELQASLLTSPLITAGDSQADTLKSLSAAAVAATESATATLAGSADPGTIRQSATQAAAALQSLTAALKQPAWAGKVGLITVGIIVLWQFAARGRAKLIPAPLLAIVVATLLALLMRLPVLAVDVPDNLLEGVTWASWSVFEDTPLTNVIVPALVLAVVASAETLLCATAVDAMHTGPRTRYDQELRAQGLGNLICGILGVLPMTGVIVRSAANVQAGAKSRLSTILHGCWLLLFSVVLTPVLRTIPTAALAGVLVYTGWRLANLKGLVHLWKQNRGDALVYLATVLVIVFKDLLSGVITGIVLSAFKLLLQFSRLKIEVLPDEGGGPTARRIRLTGAATFVRLPLLAAALEEIPAGARLTVDVSNVEFIDRACIDLLESWARQHAATGGTLEINWEELQSRFDRPRAAASGH